MTNAPAVLVDFGLSHQVYIRSVKLKEAEGTYLESTFSEAARLLAKKVHSLNPLLRTVSNSMIMLTEIMGI